MKYTGNIHAVYFQDSSLFSVKKDGKIIFFYLQNNLMKKFKKYLFEGRFVSFEYEEQNVKTINQKKCYLVQYFYFIIRKSQSRREVYYDIDVIRNGIEKLFDRQENIMFLDLEMSMMDYHMPKNFKSELLQVGLVILNKEGKILETRTIHVKPTFFPLSNRTKNFLGLWDADQSTWVDYDIFYTEFKELLMQYTPAIMVWGKNDSLYLKQSYELNQKPSLEPLCNFINLLQVVKNYFNLRNDLGLFKALQYFTNEVPEKQSHDALDDAWVTYKVYDAFYTLVKEHKYLEIDQ